MPAAKATCAKPAVEAAETEEELAAALSALLKKGHAARTNALLKDDCDLSQHIIREAERAGLDANMLLAVYMGVVAHVLNPCTLTQRYILSTPSCTPFPTSHFLGPAPQLASIHPQIQEMPPLSGSRGRPSHLASPKTRK